MINGRMSLAACALVAATSAQAHEPDLSHCVEPQDRMTEHAIKALDEFQTFYTTLGEIFGNPNPMMGGVTIVGSDERDRLLLAWESFAYTMGDEFGFRRAYDACLQNVLWPRGE